VVNGRSRPLYSYEREPTTQADIAVDKINKACATYCRLQATVHFPVHCKNRGLYFFFYGKRKENHQLGTGCFVHHRTVSAVKRKEFVSDRVSYIALRGRWCNIVGLDVYAPSEKKSDDSKNSLTFRHRASCI